MSTADELTDSTDWLNTPLAGLTPLESGLRCQVCKDFFTTPMITSCSHTFCSLCIRRYLSQEGRCPACRESDQEVKLRRNWAIEELVEHFKQSRDQILAFARRPIQAKKEDNERPKKRRKLDVAATDIPSERRSTRSQSRRLAASTPQASQESVSTQEEVADSEDEGSVYREEPEQKNPAINGNKNVHDGLVACPCCNRRMKEVSINAHLDLCIQGLATSPTPPPNTAPTGASLAYSQRTKPQPPAKQKDRLPTINYALTSETSLRKKLKELGIPAHGSKELMRKRHTEWINIWNADCDSSKPKAKRDLLRELDTWERTQGRQIERGTNSAGTGVMVKDFDREGWVKSQKDEFEDLIKKAKEKRKLVVHNTDNTSKELITPSADDDVKMAEAPQVGILSNEEKDYQEQPQQPQRILSDGSRQESSNSKQSPQHTGSQIHTPHIHNVGSNGVGNGTESRDHSVLSGITPAAPADISDAPPTSSAPDTQLVDLTSSPARPTTCSNQTVKTSATSPERSRSRFFA